MRTDRVLHVFDLAIPGARASTVLRMGKTRRSSDGQKGLVSALATCAADPSMLAVGTYAPGSLYLYDVRAGQVESGTIMEGRCMVGHGRKNKRKHHASGDKDNDDWIAAAKDSWFRSKTAGGITQLQLDDSGTMLYSASRRSNAILQWDLRMMRGVASFTTQNDTNQKLEFDLLPTDNCLFTGSTEGEVLLYDVSSKAQSGKIGPLDGGAANGVSCHNRSALVAVSSGSRQFPSQDDIENNTQPNGSSSLRLFKHIVST